MSIFSILTRTLQKRKLNKQFRPLGMKKRSTFLVSVPSRTDHVMSTLAFLGGLKTWGQVIVLVPQCVHIFYTWLSTKYFTEIIYPKSVRHFGKERKDIQQRLQNRTIHFLVELNTPVNISLPFIVNSEKRVCFFGTNNFPYYNIMMKDGYTSLSEFFNIKKVDPIKMIKFAKSTKAQVRAAYGKRKPLCFVNGPVPGTWTGDTISLDKDIPRTDPDVLSVLNCADAYSGQHDVYYEFACALKKKIVEP